jgi:hypothetical protein
VKLVFFTKYYADKIKEGEIRAVSSTLECVNEYIIYFCLKMLAKKPLDSPKNRWKDKIKINLELA